MQSCKVTRWLSLLVLLANLWIPSAQADAARPVSIAAQSGEVTAYDLILAMNTLRMSYGLPALVEDPIINAVAQATAETMAAQHISWHIGNVSGRLAAAGYGGGAKVWGTENFAVGNHSIDQIMLVWADESHMIPAVNPAYCNIGAGVAKTSDGMTYYILQAAYTENKTCGEYKSVAGSTTQSGSSGQQSAASGSTPQANSVSQLIVPVKIATPDSEGKVFHVVEAGQSFWSIAISYKITIKDLETWNNLSKDSKLQIGQRLFIPGGNTQGYATPTPVGMIQVSTPNSSGEVIHIVQPYQTLSTIAQAYGSSVENLTKTNNIQADWPLQIGQKLIIPGNANATATTRPLTPVEKLTPASDGKYYHTISSGESLSWVADLYEVKVNDLMSWNNLDAADIIQPGQKLVLHITPPATVTATLSPPTGTAAPPAPSPTMRPDQATPTPTAITTPPTYDSRRVAIAWVLIGLAIIGFLTMGYYSLKKK